ncbi:hypothetical protein ACQR1I_22650 [Bradyrhizobium sp. HKCCYLS2038]|uniref:hypothetical protein n=1 Tax=unclassified Bradyrhizobium TaxID=2631580 RepID=UPI003EBCA1A7
MMSAMLVAGAVAVLAGLGAIAYGIPIKDFSVGNTLIQSGTLGVCSGLLLFALSAVLNELKIISSRLRQQRPASDEVRPLQLPALGKRPELEPPPVPPTEELWRESGSSRLRPRMPDLASPLSSSPLPSSPLRPAAPEPAGEEVAAEPVERPKRNLLFASTSRRERERAEKRGAEALGSDFRSPPLSEPPAAPVDEPSPAEPAPPAFEDGWSRSERARESDAPRPPFPRRFTRAAPAFVEPEPAPEPEPPAAEAPPAVVIVKSGVVDGMAYSLYSDGSIEAQMPEGMMRFASIDELRTHLEGRG